MTGENGIDKTAHRVLAKIRGEIHLRVGVMHQVKAPQDRDLVLRKMHRVSREIQRDRRTKRLLRPVLFSETYSDWKTVRKENRDQDSQSSSQ